MNNHKHLPRLIAWEVTKRCHLKCKHCRADAADHGFENEFTTEEMKRTLDNIATLVKPIIILTGGEPMTRDDIYEVTSYGDSLGLRMVMAPCGQLVTPESITKMKETGIKRISLSIDGSTEESHDNFRGFKGSFRDVINAVKLARDGGLPFQINTTVTKLNMKELPDILNMAQEVGAVSFHPFLLVPTGRGKDLEGLELTPEEYEETLRWIHKRCNEVGIHVKPTCAPHYYRISSEEGGDKAHKVGHPGSHPGGGHPGGSLNASTRGCLGGTGFAFISHIGEVQICGFLDVKCGDVRESNYDFKNIWETSEIFGKMRTQSDYKGKCGICEYHDRCGGCRARAYALTGDYMKSEPYCIYIPKKVVAGLRAGQSESEASPLSLRSRACRGGSNPVNTLPDDKLILTDLQNDFPVVPRPFSILAKKYNIKEEDLLNKIKDWQESGLIRHLSAHINSHNIGFKSALVAMAVKEDEIDRVVEVIGDHPGVSHNYERDHKYSVWFTIKAPGELNLEEHVKKIAQACDVSDFLTLPVIKTYKLDVKFDASELKGASDSEPTKLSHDKKRLSSAEEVIVEGLNRGLPISSDPFSGLAKEVGVVESDICGLIEELQKRDVIKKLRFVVNHYKLGVNANAMVVWNVEKDKVDSAGEQFAKKSFISHCYERKKSDPFPYNVYTMIHAENKDKLEALITSLASEVRSKSHVALKTKRELFKRKATLLKTSYRIWEDKN